MTEVFDVMEHLKVSDLPLRLKYCVKASSKLVMSKRWNKHTNAGLAVLLVLLHVPHSKLQYILYSTRVLWSHHVGGDITWSVLKGACFSCYRSPKDMHLLIISGLFSSCPMYQVLLTDIFNINVWNCQFCAIVPKKVKHFITFGE